MQTQNRRKSPGTQPGKSQVVEINRPKGPDNPTPGAQRLIPAQDRRVIAYAFNELCRSVRWLKRVNNGLSEADIENIVREERAAAIAAAVEHALREERRRLLARVA